MSEPVPTGIQLTALDPVFREDPYPVLALLREREPVHRDTELNRIVFTRHDDVLAILRDTDMWSDPRKANPGTFTREYLARGDEEPSMLLMDDPGHRRLRELVRHPFTPRAVERWPPRTRQVAERAIAGVEDGEFELIAQVAKPIPTVVIAELLGIDASLHGEFKAWSDAMIAVSFSPVNAPEALEAAETARGALEDFFRDEIARRRRAPGEDLISAMLRAEESGDRLSEHEIVLQCNLLLLAGNLTTTDLIGNGVRALVRNPDQLAKLRARPERMKNAVEEMLRYDSPVTNSGRIADRDLEIGGEKIHRGESLSVSLAAANRDPAVYPEPDRFDIERADTHHQAFGGGRHFCLGAHLARLEAAETLAVLLARFPKLELGEGGHRHAANPSFRGLEFFWVRGGR
ncbi:MAG: cytochrome P450 [Myxococcota bacterium]